MIKILHLFVKKLATDTASSVDVALHALNWYEAKKGLVDGLLLLQPTSPFRTKENIQRGIELFINHNFQSIIGVSPTSDHPMWTLKIQDDFLVPFMQEHGIGIRSQDLPPSYVMNGYFYLIAPKELRAQHSFIGPKTLPLLIESSQEALDIDTEWDYKIAEFIVENLYEN